jgi:hypothetical protein
MLKNEGYLLDSSLCDMGIDIDWIVSHGLIERMVLDELKPLLVTDVVFTSIIPSSFVEIGLGVADKD